MEKKCSGCGYRLFGEGGQVVTCPYCRSQILIDGPPNKSVEPSQPAKNSSVATSATPTYSYTVKVPPMPRNKVAIHILLFFCTTWVGNIVYFLWVMYAKRKWMEKWGDYKGRH